MYNINLYPVMDVFPFLNLRNCAQSRWRLTLFGFCLCNSIVLFETCAMFSISPRPPPPHTRHPIGGIKTPTMAGLRLSRQLGARNTRTMVVVLLYIYILYIYKSVWSGYIYYVLQ